MAKCWKLLTHANFCCKLIQIVAIFAIRLLKKSELHWEPFAVSIDKKNAKQCKLRKIVTQFFYKNDSLKHEAYFCSKFKKKLKTLPASAAKQTKTKQKKFKLIKETKIRPDSKR